jgi:hypothetical protein
MHDLVVDNSVQMMNDIVVKLEGELTNEQLLEEFTHDQFCLLKTIQIMNELVSLSIMEGGEYELSERGETLVRMYFIKPASKEDLERGMNILIGCGMIGGRR